MKIILAGGEGFIGSLVVLNVTSVTSLQVWNVYKFNCTCNKESIAEVKNTEFYPKKKSTNA